jgi:hypothetical protein
MTDHKSKQRILHVTDYHIGARYGGIPLTPIQFLEISKECDTLEDFVAKAKLPAHSPLSVLTTNIHKADSVMMTGDMIEFINQDISVDDDTMIQVGLEFHRMLLNSASGKPVYEVLGNHERVKPYEIELARLRVRHKNYHVNAEHFKIGDALFIHGDIDIYPHLMVGERAYHKREQERGRHPDDQLVEYIGNHYVPRIMQKMPKLHQFLEKHLSPIIEDPNPLLYTAPNQAKIILHNLDVRLGREVIEGINHIFLGHTHIPYQQLVARLNSDHTIALHNSGAVIKGNFEEFEPLMITLNHDTVESIKPIKSNHTQRFR